MVDLVSAFVRCACRHSELSNSCLLRTSNPPQICSFCCSVRPTVMETISRRFSFRFICERRNDSLACGIVWLQNDVKWCAVIVVDVWWTSVWTECVHFTFKPVCSYYRVVVFKKKKKYKTNMKHLSGSAHVALTTTMYMHLGDYHKFVFLGL